MAWDASDRWTEAGELSPGLNKVMIIGSLLIQDSSCEIASRYVAWLPWVPRCFGGPVIQAIRRG
jgi:hypothetical protein